MKKVLITIAILMVILVLAIPAFAIISGPPDLDFNINSAGAIEDGVNLQVISSCIAGACTPVSTVLMQWDTDDPLGDPPPTTAVLTLTTVANVGGTGDTTLTLSEATACDTPTPVVGAVIDAVSPTLTGAVGEQVVFDSALLANYMAGQVGPAGSTGCVALTLTAQAGFFPAIIFGDMEGTQGSTAPDLLMENATAVGVNSFSANNGVSPVVWVGLLLVVVLALGAFVTMRRRDSATG